MLCFSQGNCKNAEDLCDRCVSKQNEGHYGRPRSFLGTCTHFNSVRFGSVRFSDLAGSEREPLKAIADQEGER